ncbi:MAG: flavin reductase [Odoribacteraceae bacterium]|jgi:flavin reductase (DIM6/NTAB) family NADH-FMN oxidoreductase RutF|nr:flavin reductase [Odoribacteraceae bacterium]
MRNGLILLLGLLAGCNTSSRDGKMSAAEKAFNELFTPVPTAELDSNVFNLVGKDFTVITAGTLADYNSMTASWGGWGILFSEPATWCFLRANRYTLEYIRRDTFYTMVYFDDSHRDQVMNFGTLSGRNTDKMKRHTLTPLETPAGSIAYKEAKLIIECQLTGITTVQPDDFRKDEDIKFINDGFAEAGEYHKIVFGKIINAWKPK